MESECSALSRITICSPWARGDLVVAASIQHFRSREHDQSRSEIVVQIELGTQETTRLLFSNGKAAKPAGQPQLERAETPAARRRVIQAV